MAIPNVVFAAVLVAVCTLPLGCMESSPSGAAELPADAVRVEVDELAGGHVLDEAGRPVELAPDALLYALPDHADVVDVEAPVEASALPLPACSRHKLWSSQAVHHRMLQCRPAGGGQYVCTRIDTVIQEPVTFDHGCSSGPVFGAGGNGAHAPHELATGSNNLPIDVTLDGAPDTDLRLPCNDRNTCGPLPPPDEL